MNNLPAPYQQPNAFPAGQPTTGHYPIAHQKPLHGTVELYAERPTVVYVPSAENPSVMVPVLKQYVQPMQPAPARDLTPMPLIDPQAQKILASGIGVGAAGAGVGYGLGQMFAGFALMGTSGLMILLGLLLAGAMRGHKSTHIHKTTNVHQKWFGKTNIHN